MGKHRSTDLKKAIVEFYERQEVKSIEETAKTFQVPDETVRRWIQKYHLAKTVENTYRGSMSYKVGAEHFAFIKGLINKKKDIYLREIRDELVKKYPSFDISLRHLARVVEDIPFSRKTWTVKHYPKTRYGIPLNFATDKEEFFNKLKKHNINDLIALDETNIQIGMSRRKARCYIGQRCIKRTDDNIIFQRFSLLVAISTTKVEGWLLQKGAILFMPSPIPYSVSQ